MDAATIAQVDSLVQAAVAPAKAAQQVDVAVLGHVLDTAKIQSAALVEMMRSSLDPSVGGTLDVKF